MWVNYSCLFYPHTNLSKDNKDKINATNFVTSKGTNKQVRITLAVTDWQN